MRDTPASRVRDAFERLLPNRSVHWDVVFYVPAVRARLSEEESPSAGGAETQVLLLAKELASLRVRVAVIAYGDSTRLPGEVDGVAILARSPRRSQGGLARKISEAIITWRSLWRARSRAVVTRGSGVQVGLVAVYSRLARQRMVFAAANVVDFDCAKLMPRLRDRLLYELGVRLADAIVVQTKEQVELCRRVFGRQPSLIRSIAAPARPQKAEPEAFLWVGRLASYKRPLEYVALARALPEARFWMVGVPEPRGSGDESLAEEVIAAAATTPNLDLLAPRSHAGIGELMSRAVASVNTSDFEGMPNVLLEAWSRGVPSLALTHDPDGVIVAHGLGGFAHGSRAELVRLAAAHWADSTNRQRRAEVAKRCRVYVAAHHSPERVARGWLAVLAPEAALPRMNVRTTEPELTHASH
jgi:glycosyltransferase involved in cell wall biosynthesis